ncbi:Protein FIP2 [Camellia lanceoleosa]|uniref:Protein FIP2 n=1 Tax=Camellia lanceoleosa TaxID=1840588 RepID=A0ACC0ITA6_9ERIC|nr:Protein FIP2 [Camellia lanceoleosa]
MMTMQFILLEKYRKAEEASRPVDKRVVIREEGERKYGVVKFGDVAMEEVVVKKVEELRKGAIVHLAQTGLFWLCLLGIPIGALIPRFVVKIFVQYCGADDIQIAREAEKFEGFREFGGLGKKGGGGSDDGVGMKREGDPVVEMVATIKELGGRFMRMERMKMELAREVEAMQRDMEMKWTEMLLESQEQIVEFFGKALSEKRNKKAKRMPTPKA